MDIQFLEKRKGSITFCCGSSHLKFRYYLLCITVPGHQGIPSTGIPKRRHLILQRIENFGGYMHPGQSHLSFFSQKWLKTGKKTGFSRGTIHSISAPLVYAILRVSPNPARNLQNCSKPA
jgi:hypothetical protein